MSSNKPTVPQRRAWDKDEWAAKAKERDEAAAEHAKEAEKAMLAGKKYRPKADLPKPTENMQQRTENIDLNAGVGKTTLVQTTAGSGARAGGFYCEVCNRTFKDSLSYLDHINGRFHLRALGQTTNVARSTLSQVRAKIAALREQSRTRVEAKDFDFRKRIDEVKAKEAAERERRREERRRKKTERRGERAGAGAGATARRREDESDGERAGKRRKAEDGAQAADAAGDDAMAAMMGFGGFASKRK
ncbi:U4/U6.U5 snRNP associated protein [Cryptotrichosporon argae]